MDRMIVGLTGYKQSGKSEGAKLLKGMGYTHLKFAGTLKSMVGTLLRDLGYTPVQDYLEGHMKEVELPLLGVSSRELQQTLGSEWARDTITKGIWLIIMRQKIARTQGHIVIDDVRFPNEAQCIRELGGVVIEVDRGMIPEDGHQSEQCMLDVNPDYTVNSKGLLEDYLYELEELIKHIKIEKEISNV